MRVDYVYVIAFRDSEFLMVRHARRAWEMPGGKVSPGESPEKAAVREFREETGYDVGPLKLLEVEDGGLVFLGEVGSKLPVTPNADEIAEVGFFKELPGQLSFPLVEYERMLDAARERHGAHGGTTGDTVLL
jgi:8-oxo-dGTP diphosphatase